jgi:hypothetical protein
VKVGREVVTLFVVALPGALCKVTVTVTGVFDAREVILQVVPVVQVAPLVSKLAAFALLTLQANGRTAAILELAGVHTWEVMSTPPLNAVTLNKVPAVEMHAGWDITRLATGGCTSTVNLPVGPFLITAVSVAAQLGAAQLEGVQFPGMLEPSLSQWPAQTRPFVFTSAMVLSLVLQVTAKLVESTLPWLSVATGVMNCESPGRSDREGGEKVKADGPELPQPIHASIIIPTIRSAKRRMHPPAGRTCFPVNMSKIGTIKTFEQRVQCRGWLLFLASSSDITKMLQTPG